MRCGLLGASLGHSFSPRLHALLGGRYSYELFALPPERLADFLRGGDFDALNVTVPYKRAVLPFCAALSETARATGSVNTIVRRADGSLFGENTDCYGFARLLERCGGLRSAEHVLVLGTGGASQSVQAVLRAHGAQVHVLSHRENTPDAVREHAAASVLVNATPVGMYPHNGALPLSLENLPRCRLVIDLIYNPARTALLLNAQARGIAGENGLAMLAAQARRAAELFTGEALPDSRLDAAARQLAREMRNLILIGMPGSGKSTVGRLLAERLSRPFLDSDALLAQRLGCELSDFLRRNGEAAFRAEETALLSELGKRSGCVIATGGGCVTRAENLPLLRQNGTLIWLQRELHRLSTHGRPLSQAQPLCALYAARRAHYERFADCAAENNAAPEQAVQEILEVLS